MDEEAVIVRSPPLDRCDLKGIAGDFPSDQYARYTSNSAEPKGAGKSKFCSKPPAESSSDARTDPAKQFNHAVPADRW